MRLPSLGCSPETPAGTGFAQNVANYATVVDVKLFTPLNQ